MNILITGINGFVGSNFVNAWKARYKIYGIDIVKKENTGIKQPFSTSWYYTKRYKMFDITSNLLNQCNI